jgi:hypothetical protein
VVVSATAIAAVLLATPAQSRVLAHRYKQTPNIVFVLMDNLGYGERGVYGGGVALRRNCERSPRGRSVITLA